MPDLHGWITQRIDHLEALCHTADKEHGRDWAATWTAHTDDFELLDTNGTLVARSLQPGAAGLLAIHDPAAVLRRCTADRKILEHHAPTGGTWDPYACEGCGSDSEYGALVDHTNDCPTLQALAEGYGLTEEQRAELDRPEPARPEPGPGFQMPDALIESLASFWLGTRPIEPSPEEKAIKILEPDLKKISTYVPITEEQP